VTPDQPALAGYPASTADEVVAPSGRLRPEAEVLRPALDLGAGALADAAGALAAAYRARGGELGGWVDGRFTVRPVALDPLPRVVGAADWARLADGVAQRHRALNAFLADAYRAAGRRRNDPDRAPEIVRAGVLPEWAVATSPGRDPKAVALAWPGQPRAAVAGCDVVRTEGGGWMVQADDVRVPAGLGLALAARTVIAAAVRALLPAVPVADPAAAIGRLRAALDAAAPLTVTGPPQVAVLTSGDGDPTATEHALLAEALGAPLVQPGDLWPRIDGGVAVTVGGVRTPVDVLYRRFADAELAAHRTPTGQSVAVLLAEAVRAGRLGLVNVPGNALADDPTTFAWVPAMIRFYLGEEPLLEQVRTWVLADDAQWAAVRDRLHELVLVPVAGYGGGGAVVGPECSAAELAELQVEVAAAPHRFVARTVVEPTTAPTIVEGRLLPRAVDLRVFSVSGGSGAVQALPAPLTRVAEPGGPPDADLRRTTTVKDTWLLT
jgi:uncharacterized circularly permuted ATP-grasp superfamily protein